MTTWVCWSVVSYAQHCAVQRHALRRYCPRDLTPHATCDQAFRNQYVKRAKKDPSTSVNLLLGCAGGVIACVLTHPIAIITTRIMTTAATAGAQQSLMAGISAMVTAEGYVLLFAGILPRLLHMSPFAAIVLTVYTTVLAKLMAMKQDQVDMAFYAQAGPVGVAGVSANTTASIAMRHASHRTSLRTEREPTEGQVDVEGQ